MKTEETNYEALCHYLTAVMTTIKHHVLDCLEDAEKADPTDCVMRKFRLELTLNLLAEAKDYAKKNYNYE